MLLDHRKGILDFEVMMSTNTRQNMSSCLEQLQLTHPKFIIPFSFG